MVFLSGNHSTLTTALYLNTIKTIKYFCFPRQLDIELSLNKWTNISKRVG